MCAACNIDIPAPLNGSLLSDGWGCTADCFTVDFEVIPARQKFLVGDSVQLITFSTTGHNVASWTSSGSSIALLRPQGGGMDSTIANVRSPIWVRGLAAGSAWVIATASATTLSDTAAFVVAAASAITDLRVNGADPGWPLPLGANGVSVVLLDALGRSYHARPTSWSSSDPAIAILTPAIQTSEDASFFRLDAKIPGRVTLTFTFLNVVKKVDVIITR